MSRPQITHPLALNTKVNAIRPTCACRNPKMEAFDAVILKVIHNHNGKIFYYLSNGVTVESDKIQYVITV